MTLTLPKGIWLKQGYPELLVVGAETVSVYTYIDGVALILEEQQPLTRFNQELKTITKTSDTLYEVQFWYAAASYTLERLPAFPDLPVLGEKQGWSENAALNFEALWTLLKKHFAFSKERDLDWDVLYETERTKALATQTPEELFEVFANLLRRLEDGHMGLRGLGQHVHHHNPRETHWLESWFKVRRDKDLTKPSGAELKKDGYTYMVETVLQGKAKRAANDELVWGWLPNNIGYLGFRSCCDLTHDNAVTLEELAVLEAALKNIFTDFKDSAGLIIDARFNTGGYDVVSLHLAGRFTTKPRLAFRKHEVVYNEHQPAHDVLVQPVADYYDKPVVFLTSFYTCSAAEIATMCFRVLPTVTVIGQTTEGSLSDSMHFALPNGWKGRISNEIYIAADGKFYEDLGLPPHIETPDPSHGHFWERLDETLEVAKQHLLNEVKA
jgi:carboxyl-terminal processing protease